MTDLQRAQLRASEIRARLATLGGAAELGDDERGELDRLRNEYGDVERRCQALTVAADTPVEVRTEALEMRALVGAGNVGRIFDAAMEHRPTDGADRELQAHLGLASNQVPLTLLRGLEMRATGPTPAPANVAQNQAEIIPDVFPMSCAVFLGVDMPTVGVGEAIYPVLTTSADVGVPTENNAQAETAGAFSAEVLSPSRLQASFFYSREDRARFAGMDSALRMNLADALADKLDQQILNGANGLLNGTNLDNHNVTNETTYALFREQFAYSRVDGKYASTAMDLRVVMGSGTYAHAASQYRGNNDNMDALMSLEAATGGVKVSAHVPAVASSRQNAVIRLGMRRDMVAPIWEGVTIIPDEVTKAANGQIVITAVMLHAVKILRKAGFYKQQTQHA